MFITLKQAAEKWGISDRRIRVLCSEGKIPGAYQEGRGWKIPVDAEKPRDGRYKSKESILSQIKRKKEELDTKRPLTEGEVERLNEELIDQKPLKDHMEAVGHKEAFDFVRKLVKENEPISKSIIKQIHYLVLADKKDDRGVYRRVPVRIMGAQHEPVQPFLIGPKMEQLLLDYENSDENILTKLAGFHWVIKVGDKEVVFRSSATVPRLYRAKFKRDIFKDLAKLESSYKGSKEDGEEFAIDDFLDRERK